MAKMIIWCEVTCRYCGGMAASSGYYSPDTIRLIKKETKDWIEDDVYQVLCPECAEKLGKNKRKCKGNNYE